TDLLVLVLERLEHLKITYMVVGSIASSAYGEPRFTRDIDIVIDATTEQLEQLCQSFPDDSFYVSLDAARQALINRSQFNLIHPDSGNKIDFLFCSTDAWGSEQIQRRRSARLLPGKQGMAAAPEDIILSKMLYYREGGSEKHLRDITGMFKMTGDAIDREYISDWAAKLDLMDIWQAVRKRLSM
ncbi:MAG TPA: hypothetical protein VGG19_19975, partial [Tepidisphaeraceae bacterium]